MGIVADVQAYLAAETIVDGSTGWTSVRRYLPAEPDQVVVLTEDGGLEAETPSSSGIGDSALKEPAVQVRVRGAPRDGDSALAKATEIFFALHGLMRETIGSTYYMRVKAQTSEPVFIGFDSRSRPEFTISFRALRAVADA